VRFLVDAQLPPALARLLSGLGYDASHVFDLGEVAMADRAIWKYAIEHDAVIVTKDNDFKVMASNMPGGARVVPIGLGNTRNRILTMRISAILPQIIRALESGERLVEVQ
jgi:predicted nuclease of predicted toxin-antitoxin system